NNSCGVRSIMAQFYGPGPRMSDNVHELDVLLYDGTRLKVGKTGDEELERIVDEGNRRGQIYAALRDLRDRYADLIRERYPDIPHQYLSMLPDGHGFLLVEFGGETKDEADEKARRLMSELEKGAGAPKDMKLYDDKEQAAHVWEVREAGLGATAFIPGKPDTY